MNRFYRAIYLSISTALTILPLWAQTENLPIGALEIIGNEAITSDDIQGVMKLQAVRRFGFRGQPFSRRALRGDALTIEGLYASRGYLETAVIDSFAINDGGSVDVYLTIKEGPQYLLNAIEISGNRTLATAEIIEFLGIAVGEPFNPVLTRTRLRDLSNHYQDLGKLNIDILDEKEADTGIRLSIYISEGLDYTIGGVSVSGLNSVDQKYVLRELRFNPGDNFSRSRIIESQRRIFESGLFSAVEIIPSIRAQEPGIADIEIQVRELERRSIDLTVGFQQIEEEEISGEPSTGINASGQWWHSRFWGTSMRSGITVESDFDLRNPTTPDLGASWEFITPWTFGIRLPNSVKFFTEFNQTRNFIRSGIDVSFVSSRFSRTRWQGGFGWAFILAEPDVFDSVATEGAYRSASIEYLHQGVDNLLTPSKGTIFHIKPSFVGTIVSDAPYYFKLEADIRRYHPVFNRGVLAYRLKAGYLETLPAGNSVHLAPSIDRFDLGGSTSLRGWTRPHNFSPLGGVLKGLFNLELRFPIIWIIGGELFMDGGVLRAFEQENYDQLSWIWGWDTGAGINLLTPLGPIRFDAAKPAGHNAPDGITLQMALLYTF
ncbi:MAG: BamA/TamA family outer membrane protein [Candidatus Marinimicrobia bacterium]|nr:BamA/TamA family outer membrane protein [Candidatus Neomarinimicrobiota bacterium]